MKTKINLNYAIIMLLIAAAVGIVFYSLRHPQPEEWENSLFVMGEMRYGDIY